MNIFKMDDEYIYGKNDIFSVIIMFKYLLEDDEFRLMLKVYGNDIDFLNIVVYNYNSVMISRKVLLRTL